MTHKQLILAGVGAVALAAISAGATYALTNNYYQGLAEGIHLIRDTNTTYQFISPLLNITTPKGLAGNQFAPLVSKVRAVANAEPRNALIRYSFYFRDLTNTYWTGINENDQYDPASMLKVVAAIAAYKQGEDHPGFLESRPVYTQQLADINAQFPHAPAIALRVGNSYSIPFLVQEMLSDSDNAAKDLLLSSISDAELNDIYTDLTIPLPSNTDSSAYTISSLDYSRFFRVLYNGTYLSRSESNDLLGYLTKATFVDALIAGVASSTPIAHKFGEHVNGTGSTVTSVELHDCGIVYHPTNPYFVCVMTEGSDEATLANFIASVSKVVYSEVSSGYK